MILVGGREDIFFLKINKKLKLIIEIFVLVLTKKWFNFKVKNQSVIKIMLTKRENHYFVPLAILYIVYDDKKIASLMSGCIAYILKVEPKASSNLSSNK